MRKLKVGLALGGGGVRGFAHLGVLKTLQKHKIPIDVIAGTSMGAIIGGLYALQPNIDFLEKKVQEILASNLFIRLGRELLKQEEGKPRIKFFHRFISYVKQMYLYGLYGIKTSLLGEDKIKEILEMAFPPINIEETKIPFACVSADLCKGEEVVFFQGPVRKSVQASISIPGVFPPLRWNDKLLIDGAVTEDVPVSAAFKLGADVVIAVDVRSRLRYITDVDNGLAIIFRANSINRMKFTNLQLEQADFILTPRVGNISWMNFKKADYSIKQGEKEANSKIKEIRSLIRKSRKKTFFKRFFAMDEHNNRTNKGRVDNLIP